jgi:hypothetical protein
MVPKGSEEPMVENERIAVEEVESIDHLLALVDPTE